MSKIQIRINYLQNVDFTKFAIGLFSHKHNFPTGHE